MKDSVLHIFVNLWDGHSNEIDIWRKTDQLFCEKNLGQVLTKGNGLILIKADGLSAEKLSGKLESAYFYYNISAFVCFLSTVF